MAVLSNTLQNKLVDYFRGVVPPAAPANYYAAYMTASPTDAGGGTELVASGYARVAIPANTTAWAGTQAPASTGASTGTGGVTSNNAEIDFGVINSTATIGTVALYDAATAGNLVAYGPLTAPITLDPAKRSRIAAGALQLTIGN
jgi:hypothetical protein